MIAIGPRQSQSLNGTVLVANMDDDSVWLIDLPSGAMAAVTNYGDERGPGNLIQLIDLEAGSLTGELVGRVTGLQVPYRLAATGDGRTIIVSDPPAEVLVFIDRASAVGTARVDIAEAAREVVRFLPTGAAPDGIDFTPVGGR